MKETNNMNLLGTHPYRKGNFKNVFRINLNFIKTKKPLPLCKPLRFVQFGREEAGEYLWLAMQRPADES